MEFVQAGFGGFSPSLFSLDSKPRRTRRSQSEPESARNGALQPKADYPGSKLAMPQ
jgi:hypothetical protein